MRIFAAAEYRITRRAIEMDFVFRCLDSMRNRISHFRHRRRRTRRSLRLTSIHGLLCNRNAPFKFAIEQLANVHLTAESTTTLDDKLEAIASIGHLSWTGGAEAAEFTAKKYMHTFALLLRDSDTPHDLKLQIIKSLSEICYGNKVSQDLARDHMLIDEIIEYMNEVDEEETRKWSLHTLFFMLCNNNENQLQAIHNSTFKVCTLRGLEDNWEGWEHNEAQELETMTELAMKSPSHSPRRSPTPQ